MIRVRPLETELGSLSGFGVWEALLIGVLALVAALVVAALVKYIFFDRRPKH